MLPWRSCCDQVGRDISVREMSGRCSRTRRFNRTLWTNVSEPGPLSIGPGEGVSKLKRPCVEGVMQKCPRSQSTSSNHTLTTAFESASIPNCTVLHKFLILTLRALRRCRSLSAVPDLVTFAKSFDDVRLCASTAPEYAGGVPARSRILVTNPGHAAAPRCRWRRARHGGTGPPASRPRHRRCSHHQMHAEQASSLDTLGNAGGNL